METQKNDENIILKLKKHLGKMMVQVDFLYRNGRPLEQFDYDILMDRTRELYELLIDLQEIDQNPNFDPNPNFDDEENQNDEALNNDVEFEIEIPGETEKNEEENPVEEEDDIDDEDWEDEEDVTFHVEDEEERGEIREERLAMSDERLERREENPVDNSLAARLQRQPISDIKSGVTLNDRIMMIHDLFKGSEERYNKTISVLNEFPTVGGAIVYLSELRVELQWDVESEAYMKLQELVQRRFL